MKITFNSHAEMQDVVTFLSANRQVPFEMFGKQFMWDEVKMDWDDYPTMYIQAKQLMEI